MLNCSAWHPNPNGNTQIFYRKRMELSSILRRHEGIRIDPEVLTEDFMLCIVPTEELENYKVSFPRKNIGC